MLAMTFESPFCARSVDPLTCDLPGIRIEHQTHRAGPVAQKGKTGVVAAIREELVAGQGHDRDRGPIRSGSKSEVAVDLRDFRFTPDNGHRSRLSAFLKSANCERMSDWRAVTKKFRA